MCVLTLLSWVNALLKLDRNSPGVNSELERERERKRERKREGDG